MYPTIQANTFTTKYISRPLSYRVYLIYSYNKITITVVAIFIFEIQLRNIR